MDVILSVKPRYAHLIIDGKKDIELRRTRPRFDMGMTIYIYSTFPEKSIIGQVKVKNLIWKKRESIWRKYNDRTGITRKEFLEYIQDQSECCGIELENPYRFSSGISLALLKEVKPNFTPPQSYCFVDENSEIMTLLSHSA